MYQKGATSRANKKQNKIDQIFKCVQDSYAMSGEPVDAKATVANAKDKADKLKSIV